MEQQSRLADTLSRLIEFLLYLTAVTVPLVYYNNPIATEYFFDKAFYFDLLVYAAATLFFIRALVLGRLTLRVGSTFIPLALFCLVALQSLLGASNPWKGWETIARVGAAVPFLFLMYQETGTREGLYKFLRVTALANIAITGYGFLQYYEVFPLPRDQYGTADPSTTIGLTNFVMEYLAVFMFVTPMMIAVEKRRVWRGVFTLATLFIYYYFALSDNRAAMVGFVLAAVIGVVLAFLLWLRGLIHVSKRNVSILAAVGVIAVTIFLVSPLAPRVWDRIQSLFSSHRDDSITFRIETYRQTVQIFLANPVRGVGMSNIEVVFPKYFSPFLEDMTLKKNTRVTQVHNEYLQVLGDLGLLGAIVFAAFLAMLVRLWWLTLRRVRSQEDTLVVLAMVMGTFSFLVISFFAFPFQVPSSNLSMFLAVGILEVMAHRVLPAGEEGVHEITGAAVQPLAGVATAVVFLFWAYSSIWMWSVTHAEVNFKEARITREFGHPEESKRLLEEAIRLYPQNEAYYYDRAYFSISEGNTQEALDYLQATARLVPNYAVGRKQIGIMNAQLGNYEKAAQEFEAAFSIYRTQYKEYVPLLVNAYLGMGDTARAMATPKQLIDKDYIDPMLKYQYGRALLAARRVTEAVDWLEKAAKEQPGDAETTVQLAAALIESNRYAEGLARLDSLAGKNLSPTEGYTAAAARVRAFSALNRPAEAEAVLRATLAEHPNWKSRFALDPSVTGVPKLRALLMQP
jgi:O-antigen ligase/tetratricopeptide (TPR) repeat protein